jgi:hypothetical protein
MKTRTIVSALLGLVLSICAFAAQAQVCSVGDRADVLWKGKWYSASVTRVNDTQSRCYIHYTGYGSNWDEWVGQDRIRILAHATAPAFRAGDPVAVKWKGKWYPASVLRAHNGKYHIHYDQYDNSWDEWVGSDRIRPR